MQRGLEVQLHAIFALGLDGGEWSASRPGRTVPGKGLLVLIVWAPEPVWNLWKKKKTFSAISRIAMLRYSGPLPSHYNDWAIPAPPLPNFAHNEMYISHAAPFIIWSLKLSSINYSEIKAVHLLSLTLSVIVYVVCRKGLLDNRVCKGTWLQWP